MSLEEHKCNKGYNNHATLLSPLFTIAAVSDKQWTIWNDLKERTYNAKTTNLQNALLLKLITN